MAGGAPGLLGSLARQRRAFDEVARACAPGRGRDGATGARPDEPRDPVHLVRRYASPGDREVAGLIAAVLAYGQVGVLCREIGKILEELAPSPRAAILEGRHESPRFCRAFRYRFTRRRDLVGLLHAAAEMIRAEGGLGAGLARRRNENADPVEALARWVHDLRASAESRAGRSRGLTHLLADPARGGACKRWWLYLRWMVRPDDGTDLGSWSALVPASDLVLPLDTHWIRMAPRLGLTARRTPDGKMAREITAALRRIGPEDPLRYDYPVCHLGIEGRCPPKLTAAHCRACPLRGVCPTGARMARKG